MNERGFFTVIGLCFILSVAMMITSVQDFEGNYSSGVKISLAEAELRNAADSALFEAVSKNIEVDKGETKEIPVTKPTSEYLEDLNVEVFCKRQSDNKVFIAVASCDTDFMYGKIYQRVLAFKVEGEETIHFVTDP